MSLASSAIENKTVSYFTFFLIFIAGIASFFSLGQLEDPDFTVKTAVVVTGYPGASAVGTNKAASEYYWNIGFKENILKDYKLDVKFEITNSDSKATTTPGPDKSLVSPNSMKR